MFLYHLLLVFVVIPAVLILLAVATPPGVRAWALFVGFPTALVAFAALRLILDRDSEDEEGRP